MVAALPGIHLDWLSAGPDLNAALAAERQADRNWSEQGARHDTQEPANLDLDLEIHDRAFIHDGGEVDAGFEVRRAPQWDLADRRTHGVGRLAAVVAPEGDVVACAALHLLHLHVHHQRVELRPVLLLLRHAAQLHGGSLVPLRVEVGHQFLEHVAERLRQASGLDRRGRAQPLQLRPRGAGQDLQAHGLGDLHRAARAGDLELHADVRAELPYRWRARWQLQIPVPELEVLQLPTPGLLAQLRIVHGCRSCAVDGKLLAGLELRCAKAIADTAGDAHGGLLPLQD
mmetsp:Transcript_15417/g.48624  ORF Transcript_15417/g.48624 Transcript_15417/m.48624 type:complete len:286 (+) Transcript_15417:261-1118(+)